MKIKTYNDHSQPSKHPSTHEDHEVAKQVATGAGIYLAVVAGLAGVALLVG